MIGPIENEFERDLTQRAAVSGAPVDYGVNCGSNIDSIVEKGIIYLSTGEGR